MNKDTNTANRRNMILNIIIKQRLTRLLDTFKQLFHIK